MKLHILTITRTKSQNFQRRDIWLLHRRMPPSQRWSPAINTVPDGYTGPVRGLTLFPNRDLMNTTHIYVKNSFSLNNFHCFPYQLFLRHIASETRLTQFSISCSISDSISLSWLRDDVRLVFWRLFARSWRQFFSPSKLKVFITAWGSITFVMPR